MWHTGQTIHRVHEVFMGSLVGEITPTPWRAHYNGFPYGSLHCILQGIFLFCFLNFSSLFQVWSAEPICPLPFTFNFSSKICHWFCICCSIEVKRIWKPRYHIPTPDNSLTRETLLWPVLKPSLHSLHERVDIDNNFVLF